MTVIFTSCHVIKFFLNLAFSIYNDTKENYYVTHLNCQAALWSSVGAVLIVTGIGAAGAAAECAGGRCAGGRWPGAVARVAGRGGAAGVGRGLGPGP